MRIKDLCRVWGGRKDRCSLPLSCRHWDISIIYMLFINMVSFFAPSHWNLRRMRARIFFFVYSSSPMQRTEIGIQKCSMRNLKNFFSSISLLLPAHLPPPSCLCAQSYNPMDCSPPGSSAHGLCQARILQWVAISFSKHFFIFIFWGIHMLYFFPAYTQCKK